MILVKELELVDLNFRANFTATFSIHFIYNTTTLHTHEAAPRTTATAKSKALTKNISSRNRSRIMQLITLVASQRHHY
jgi:hypothetical protein